MLRTFKRFALDQIQVVRLLQNATLESTAQSLQIATIDVKQEVSHFHGSERNNTLSREQKCEFDDIFFDLVSSRLNDGR